MNYLIEYRRILDFATLLPALLLHYAQSFLKSCFIEHFHLFRFSQTCAFLSGLKKMFAIPTGIISWFDFLKASWCTF